MQVVIWRNWSSCSNGHMWAIWTEWNYLSFDYFDIQQSRSQSVAFENRQSDSVLRNSFIECAWVEADEEMYGW